MAFPVSLSVCLQLGERVMIMFLTSFWRAQIATSLVQNTGCNQSSFSYRIDGKNYIIAAQKLVAAVMKCGTCLPFCVVKGFANRREVLADCCPDIKGT